MQERRAREVERWGALLQRIEDVEKKLAELSGRPNGKTDEEIIGIVYKEVGKGAVSFIGKLFLYACGAIGTGILAWLGFKGYPK